MKVREVQERLRGEGFAVVRQKGSHEQWVHGTRRVTVVGNHRNDDISPQNMRYIAAQAGWAAVSTTRLASASDASADAPPARSLTQTDKVRIVAQALRRPVASVAEEFGVSIATIEEWVVELNAPRLPTTTPATSVRIQAEGNKMSTTTQTAKPRRTPQEINEILRAAAKDLCDDLDLTYTAAARRYSISNNFIRYLGNGNHAAFSAEMRNALIKRQKAYAERHPKNITSPAHARAEREGKPRSRAKTQARSRSRSPLADIELENKRLRAVIAELENKLLEFMRRDLHAQIERNINGAIPH